MRIMSFFLWVVALLGGLFGALTFGLTMTAAESAPQEAAGAAMGIAFAAIPYVVARAWDGIARTQQKS